MATRQKTIFPPGDAPDLEHESVGPNSTLMAAVRAYRNHMQEAGFSTHTVKAFSADLRLLQNYVGPQIPIHELGTQELNQFLYWLRYERGVPCSPKSYARRVTTLKSFFGWLTSIHVTPFDPAASILHPKITVPLPTVLQDDEIDRLLEVTEAMASAPRLDPRPHLLATLLLQTGIKKAECMQLTPDDFEDSDPERPTVLIRYHNPRLLHKERRLDVSPGLMHTLGQYLARYRPARRIFECTPRNLEYVLTDAAGQANLPHSASFESLRGTCAYRDFRDGMPHDQLRQKLGLSKVTFRETLRKLEELAAKEKDA
ncbi:MAG: tyrosine-type recombinase/integrase [Anaerolineae bacterium]